MPAVTVADWTVLPRVIAAPTQVEDRAPVSVTTAPRGFEGEGFPVHRAFAGVDPTLLDPFIHMDQMGEVEYAPGEPKGTPWHPHRGFETVTYMIDGVMDHQDTHGGGGSITDGDTQWMTAGSGLLHIETPPEWLVVKGGLFHGLQLWVNLPKADKWLPPHYQDISRDDVGLASTPDAGALLRVIAGEVDSVKGPGSTHTPMTMVHATVLPGAEMTVPWRTDFNALVYVLGGSGYVGRERRPISSGQLAVLGHGETHHGRRRPAAGLAPSGARGRPARRSADPRADGLRRSVRHEHQGRGAAGVRGLPEGQARHDPDGPARRHPRRDPLAAG